MVKASCARWVVHVKKTHPGALLLLAPPAPALHTRGLTCVALGVGSLRGRDPGDGGLVLRGHPEEDICRGLDHGRQG